MAIANDSLAWADPNCEAGAPSNRSTPLLSLYFDEISTDSVLPLG
jgi:hypothetical protein